MRSCPGPWRQQAVLGRSHWDAEAVAILRDYVVENLADPDAVLVIDETGFLKQSKGYVLGVASSDRTSRSSPARRRTSPRGSTLRPGSGCRPSEGTEGPRLHDWAYYELADLDAGDYDETRS